MFKSINLKRVIIIFIPLFMLQIFLILFLSFEFRLLDFADTDLIVSKRTHISDGVYHLAFVENLRDYLDRFLTDMNVVLSSVLIRMFLILTLLNLFVSLIISYLISRYVPLNTKEQENILKYKTEIDETNIKKSNLEEDVNKINSYIAHELKNMLNVLSLQMQNNEYVEATNQVKLIDETIEDLNALTLNKVSTSKYDVLELTAQISDKFNQVNFDFDEGNYMCELNKSLFERAVINIINNAIKAEANNIYIKMSGKESNIIIKISNDGKRLTKKEADNIFNYRYKLNELSKSGNGIGLSLVYNVMDLFSGTVYVDVNDMVTFYLILPTAE